MEQLISEKTHSIQARYALTILLDLADPYLEMGSTPDSIGTRHKIPMPELALITDKLEQLGVIVRTSDIYPRLRLQKKPHSRWIFEMLALLKQHF